MIECKSRVTAEQHLLCKMQELFLNDTGIIYTIRLKRYIIGKNVLQINILKFILYNDSQKAIFFKLNFCYNEDISLAPIFTNIQSGIFDKYLRKLLKIKQSA